MYNYKLKAVTTNGPRAAVKGGGMGKRARSPSAIGRVILLFDKTMEKLSVNVFAVADGHHQNQQLAIFDLAENAVIPNPVTPQAGQISPDPLAKAEGISISGNSLVGIDENVPLGLVSELLEVLQCPFIEPVLEISGDPSLHEGVWMTSDTDTVLNKKGISNRTISSWFKADSIQGRQVFCADGSHVRQSPSHHPIPRQ